MQVPPPSLVRSTDRLFRRQNRYTKRLMAVRRFLGRSSFLCGRLYVYTLLLGNLNQFASTVSDVLSYQSFSARWERIRLPADTVFTLYNRSYNRLDEL